MWYFIAGLQHGTEIMSDTLTHLAWNGYLALSRMLILLFFMPVIRFSMKQSFLQSIILMFI